MKHTSKYYAQLICGGLLIAAPISVQASDWSWSIEPYFMATNIDGDAAIGRATGIDVAVDTSDILENLELAAMVHFEGLHSSNWGFMLDYGFMKLGSDLSNPLGGVTDVTVRQGIFEAFGFHRVESDHGYLDIYAGLRWWDNDFDVTIDPVFLPGSISPSVSEDWIDPVFGLRYFHDLGEKLNLGIQADVGGFGVGSDISYSFAIGGVYHFSDSLSLDLKYRALWVDYESGSAGNPGHFKYETSTHGPIAGLIFNF